jgi:EamA-like transporter family.
MSNWSPRIYGVLTLGVLSFAFAPILVRWAGAVPGLAIAVWRTVTAAAVLVPVAAVRARGALRRLTTWDMVLTGTAGVFLGLHFIAWIESLYHTTVASASVLVTTSPIILAALGYWLLGERLTRGTVLAIGIAVGGAGLIGWADAGTVKLGRGALLGTRWPERCGLVVCTS